MLVILLSVLVNVGWGQGAEEYNFKLYQVTDNDRYSTEDPKSNLSLDCFAANGYGQWTSSANLGVFSTDLPGWFLLGNGIFKPSQLYDPLNTVSHPRCIPPGIVQNGVFQNGYPSTVKVAANMDGMVRYVSIANDRQSFIIEGLNAIENGSDYLDQNLDIDLNQVQIDISLEGIPLPADTRKIVKRSIFSYSPRDGQNIATTMLHPVANNEIDSRDLYDVAIDNWYLYLVWTTTTNCTAPNTSEVWGLVIDLRTNQVVNGYPKRISGNNNGMRPTVACEIRGNRLTPIRPLFDVAYLTGLTQNDLIKVAFIDNNVITESSLLKTFVRPVTPFDDVPISSYTHIRNLVSSIHYGEGNNMKVLYTITNDNHLIQYRPLTGVPGSDNIIKATYVDGPLSPFYPAPLAGVGHSVVDKHIIAFANPYDADVNYLNYKQFHCLYQLNVFSQPQGMQNPLLIVRDDDAAIKGILQDTRTIITKDNIALLLDPEKYVGGVNQMGIHIHWRTTNNHFYKRDLNRKFDEPIDENTLVTNVCEVGNSPFQGHLGLPHLGAILCGDKKMTLWTDLNYGMNESNPDAGLYTQNNSIEVNSESIATLKFTENSILSIGVKDVFGLYGYPQVDGFGHLILPPNFRIFMNNGEIQVGPFSSLHYYGKNEIVNSFSPDGVGGVIRLLSMSGEQLPGQPPIRWRSTLRIHGGADLLLAPFNKLISEDAIIKVLYEGNILPWRVDGAPNPNATGIITNKGEIALTKGYYDSFIPLHSYQTTHKGLNTSLRHGSTFSTFTATETTFENLGGAARLEFGLENESSPVNKVLFDQCSLISTNIHVFNPDQTVTISDNDFFGLFGRTVFMKRDDNLLSSSYAQILVDDNVFFDKRQDMQYSSGFEGYYGIFFRNFFKTGLEGKVVVSNNDFRYLDNLEGWMQDAIHFENTTGEVLNNRVDDDGYLNGITNIGTQISGGVTPNTYTYMCDNEIYGLWGATGEAFFGVAIYSSYNFGYIKKNVLVGCSYGLISGESDWPILVFNLINGNNFTGIKTSSSTSIVDLSGVHGADNSGDDYAAYNEIKENGNGGVPSTQILLAEGSHIEFADRLSTWAWTEWGENNILGYSGHPLLIAVNGTPSTQTDIGSLDKNFWGTNIDPSRGNGISPGSWGLTTDVHCTDINYTATTAETRTILTTVPFSVSCSGGFNALASKTVKPQQVLVTDDTCQLLLNFGYSFNRNSMYEAAYDSLRKFVETCPLHKSAYEAFPQTGLSVNKIQGNDSLRYEEYREWLISVLYLNTIDYKYYCADVGQIMNTFGYRKGYERAFFTVLRYLLDHPKCNNLGLQQLWDNSWASLRYDWWKGDTTVPFDSTWPSLDSIGLGFLTKLDAPEVRPAYTSKSLGNAIATPNPFKDNIEIKLELLRSSYLGYTVFDALGKEVVHEAPRYMQSGEHILPIPFPITMSSGTYFVRILGGFGEVRTVKVVKE